VNCADAQPADILARPSVAVYFRLLNRAGEVSEGEGFPLTTPALGRQPYAETLSPLVEPVAAAVDAAAVADAANRLITICSLLFAPRLNVTC